MNMYLHELRVYRKNTLLWTLSMCAATAFLFWMFPAFSQATEGIRQMIANFPMALQIAFGLDLTDISTVTGYYSFIITFLMLCGAVQAITLGLSMLSRETTGKTVDFLLTKPVARTRVLAAKLLAGATCVTLTSAAYLGAATGMAHAVSETAFTYQPFLLMSLAFYFVQLIFLALGFCISAIRPKIRSVLPVGLSTVFGLFILGMVAAALERTELYYLTPFKYFDTAHILLHSAYEPSYALTGAVVAAVCVVTGFVVYTRRDIHAS